MCDGVQLLERPDEERMVKLTDSSSKKNKIWNKYEDIRMTVNGQQERNIGIKTKIKNKNVMVTIFCDCVVFDHKTTKHISSSLSLFLSVSLSNLYSRACVPLISVDSENYGQ